MNETCIQKSQDAKFARLAFNL